MKGNPEATEKESFRDEFEKIHFPKNSSQSALPQTQNRLSRSPCPDGRLYTNPVVHVVISTSIRQFHRFSKLYLQGNTKGMESSRDFFMK